MSESKQKAKAQLFRALHADSILVLANAWDAGSAALIARAGVAAIATTSGGMAWSLGRGDGQQVSREAMAEAIGRVVAAVDVPVTADIEGGYGPEPKDVAATVEAVVAAGAVGINLEDSGAADGGLFSVDEQVARIRAAREAAGHGGLDELVINSRTDVFLFQIGSEEGRLDEVRHRTSAYAAAGADVIFVPGLVDLAVLREFVAGSELPVNVLAGPGAPSVAEFGEVGVRRVSTGTSLSQAAYTLARTAAEELLAKGTYTALAGAQDYGSINALFTDRV